MLRYRWPYILLASLLCWVGAAGAQTAAPRMALLIGNSAYKGDWPVLKNTVNDARDLGQRLKELGWQTTVTENRTGDQMLSDVQDFIVRAQKAKAGQLLLYFSGHGAEWDKGAFLIPVDLPSDHGLAVSHKSMSLQKIVTSLQAAPGLKLVMLDACRTRPGSKDGSGGLPSPEAEKPLPNDVLVAYASEALQAAMDSGERNGVYASGLLKALSNVSKTGASFNDVMAETEEEVQRLSRSLLGRQQNPKTYVSSSSAKRFAFASVDRPVPLTDSRTEQENQRLKAELDKLREQAAKPNAVKSALTDWDRYVGMVELPMGSYLRGSQDEDERNTDEGPVKRVDIRYRLAMGRTEVTRKLFGEFVAERAYKTEAERSGGCRVKTGGEWKNNPDRDWRKPGFAQDPDHPVVCVSWNDAQAFVQWLNQKAGLSSNDPHRYRLPSESEWEYAARGVTSPEQNRNGAQHWRYPWGNDAQHKDQCRYANGADQTLMKDGWTDIVSFAECEDGHVYTAPAGKLVANAFGLHDMLGNAWEWTQDCWRSDYDQYPVDGKPYEQASCASRSLRGGSWSGNARLLRSAYRNGHTPSFASFFVGFRLTRMLPSGS
jgi:formylglycine-generating enzyme required for sulfatase activity